MENKESNKNPLEISDIKTEDMKKRMNELENQLKIQNENLNQISSLANKKEEKLNNDISQYLKQINDLKNELELLNGTITNLTEEKENNTIKLTELIQENEKLKKNKNSSVNNKNNNEQQNKKYEDLIVKLKKNIVKLNEDKKSLEEVIIKQEEKVNELTLKVDNTKKEIDKKDKELKESIEYNAKLTNTINFHKKEIQKLKQSTNLPINNKNKDKDVINIMNLQKEIQIVRKEIETKDNKINLLSMNNKILQGKVNKLSQTTKTGFNCEQNAINNNTNNIKDVKTSIVNPKYSDKLLHKDKNKVFIVAKPKQGPNTPEVFNNRQNSTSLRVKNDFYKNNEDNLSNNNEIYNKSKYSNMQQKRPQKRNNSNINNIKRQQNIKNSANLNNINININKSNYINKNNSNNQINKFVDMKYKEIESKYKKEINKEMKDDTLFDEDIINNFDIKEEIIVGNNIEPIEIVSNMASQTLKPKKNNKININDQSMNTSQEKDFQIIESYCQLSGQKDESNNNDNSNFNKDNKDDESKMENNQVQELHNHVKKILDEFN